MKQAKDYHKRYANQRRQDLEFEVGDKWKEDEKKKSKTCRTLTKKKKSMHAKTNKES